jgi:DNA polymerase-3 subunit beta
MIKTIKIDAALQVLAPATGGKMINILSCVMMNAENGRIRLTSTNTELQISTHIDAEVSTPVNACVDYQKLTQFAKSASGQEINIKLDKDKLALKARSRSSLNALPISDFPEMFAETDGAVSVSMDAAELSDAIDSIAFACASGHVTPALNGMLFRVTDGVLTISASDAMRLATTSIPVQSSESIDAIIPKQSAMAIAKTFRSGEITILLRKNNLSITNGDTCLIAKNIEARYPDFSKVLAIQTIPGSVDQSQLIESIGAVMLSAPKSGAMGFSFDNDTLVLNSKNEQGEESVIDASIHYDGNPLFLCANYAFVVDAAKKLNGKIDLGLGDRFLIMQDDSKKALYVVMTMRT